MFSQMKEKVNKVIKIYLSSESICIGKTKMVSSQRLMSSGR